MKLIIDLLENPIDITDDKIVSLHITNVELYREIISRFEEVDINKIFLFNDSEELSIKNEIYFLLTPYSFDFESKDILNKIVKLLEKEVCDNVDYQIVINQKYSDFIETIVEYLSIYEKDLDIDKEFELKKILKMISPKIYLEESMSLMDKVIKIIEVCKQYNLCKLLVLNGIKSYFNDDELSQIYKIAIYNKINMLILHQGTSEVKHDYEKIIIIDEDYCMYEP